MPESYSTQAKGIRIFPGQWRPHYPWEQIAWISPPWPSQDYIWLDFPEAIFTDQGLLYLSHINPAFPVVFPQPPKVEWTALENGIAFERPLPDGVRFGGNVRKRNENTVGLELFIHNGSSEPLANIKLQTCAYLRAIEEFAHPTMANKYVHLPEKGWTSWLEAIEMEEGKGKYRLGWRGGKPIADKPAILSVSSVGTRCVTMTWFEDTHSLVGNPSHPCMHADPRFKDIDPSQKATIQGEIAFSEILPDGLEG